MSAYTELKKISEKVGWPSHYKEDLTIYDKAILKGYKKPFLWMLRETGTQIAVLHDRTKEEIKASKDMFEYFFEGYGGDNWKVYYFNGEVVAKIKTADAKKLFDDAIEQAIGMDELKEKTFTLLAAVAGSWNKIKEIKDCFFDQLTIQIAKSLLKLSRKRLLEMNGRMTNVVSNQEKMAVLAEYIRI